MTVVWLPSNGSEWNEMSGHEAAATTDPGFSSRPALTGARWWCRLGALIVTRLTMIAILFALVGVLFHTYYDEFRSCVLNKWNVVLDGERVGWHIQVTIIGADATSVPCRLLSPNAATGEENSDRLEDYAIILHSRNQLDLTRWPPASISTSARCGVKHYTINFAGIQDPEGHRCTVVPRQSGLKLKKDHCALVHNDITTAPASLDDLLEKMSAFYYSSDQSDVSEATNQMHIDEPALNFTDYGGLFISRDCADYFTLIVFNVST